MADVVERVGGEALPEEVVPDGLHPGEARTGAGGVRRVACRGAGRGGPRVGLHGAPAIVDRLQELPQRLGQRGRPAGQAAQLLDLLVARTHRPDAHARGVAERLESRSALLREGAQALEEHVQLAGRRAEIAQHRYLSPGELAQPAHVGLELAQEGGQPGEALGQVGAARRGDLGGLARLPHEAGHVGLAVLERADHGLAVADQALDLLGLAAEDAQRLAGLAQARMRAPQHVGEVLRAAGQTRAQLGHDQPQPVAVGPADDVVHEVERDRGAGLLHRQAPAVGQALVRVAGLTVHEVLADQRLRTDLAACVAAQVGQPGLCDPGLHQRQRPGLGPGDPESAGAARPYAGHLEVAAFREAEGVVEQDLVGLLGVVLRAAVRAQGQRGAAAGQHREEGRQRAPHGPTDRWLGSQPS